MEGVVLWTRECEIKDLKLLKSKHEIRLSLGELNFMADKNIWATFGNG
jgi:hypothetical protein